jgi:hypothetical protein
VQISRVPGAEAPDASFGLLAAQALEAGLLDGFWGNAVSQRTPQPCLRPWWRVTCHSMIQ